LSPKFGFFKRKTSDNVREKKGQGNSIQTVTSKELLEIIEKEKKLLETALISDLHPVRRSVLDCLDRLKTGASELERQEIKVENPQFESLINTSKGILITSIKKESFIESAELDNYEDVIKFKNNLELLINRFGQVGDSHNRILNEFLRKQINKLKNEFDNLSSLLKQVTKILSVKESQINKTIVCRDDLVLFAAKVNEMKEKKQRLSELSEEVETIDKNIEEGKIEYEGFKRSQEYLLARNTLEKINGKKSEIDMFEKNMINMVSGLSRPITKFSYLAPKETQGRLALLQNQPLEIFNDRSQYVQLFGELRKKIADNSIQVKDPEKTINQIDEMVKSLPLLSSNLKNLRKEISQLDSSINSKNMVRLDDMKMKTEMYEKRRSESVSNMDETNSSIHELDSAIEILKKKIEDNVSDITGRDYSIRLSSS